MLLAFIALKMLHEEFGYYHSSDRKQQTVRAEDGIEYRALVAATRRKVVPHLSKQP